MSKSSGKAALSSQWLEGDSTSGIDSTKGADLSFNVNLQVHVS